MIRYRFVLQFSCLLVLATALAGNADEPKDKPLAALDQFSYLTTGYFHRPLSFRDEVKAHSITINPGQGPDGVYLNLNPNAHDVNLFGDALPGPNNALGIHRFKAKLVAFNMPDPLKLGRKVYAIECKELGDRLFLVTPAKKDGRFLLVVRDKDGGVEAVLNLNVEREPPLPPPCHPGCFPAGTMVETPDGLKKIESIKPGDKVLNVPDKGKAGAIKVASIFVGDSDLVEVDTEAGKLVSTAKQPLSLIGGGTRSAGSLTAGDSILRWKDSKTVAVKVRGVKPLEKPARVFNLILEERGTFIANGFLVRSKPPAEK